MTYVMDDKVVKDFLNYYNKVGSCADDDELPEDIFKQLTLEEFKKLSITEISKLFEERNGNDYRTVEIALKNQFYKYVDDDRCSRCGYREYNCHCGCGYGKYY